MGYIKRILEKYRELILYIIFGVATTVVNWIVYSVFVSFLGVNVSNIIAWSTSVVFAFFVNKFLVFRQTKASETTVFREALLFLGARLFSGVVEIVGLPLLIKAGVDGEIFSIEGSMAKIIVSVVVIVLNYIFSKFFIFKKDN